MNICLFSNKNNSKLYPSIYERYLINYKCKYNKVINKNDECKKDRYLFLNIDKIDTFTRSNPYYGWIHNCIGCETLTSNLISLKYKTNDYYFYVCKKCEPEFFEHDFKIIESKEIYEEKLIDWKYIVEKYYSRIL